MNYDIVFESDRIYFIKVTDQLVNDYLKMVNNFEIQKCISSKTRTYTLEQELEWINNKLNENAVIFSMIDKETKKFIGNIEIMNIVNGSGVLGIVITPNQQNKKFGQEAIKRIIDYAFDKLKFDYLDLYVFNFNLKAIHCYEKVGFRVIGKGKLENEIHMRLVNSK